jgi:transcriptional regulator with XRE-family HTH domain
MADESGGGLADRLRALRGDIPQRTIAKGLGVSVPLISSWETGKAVPPAERIGGYAQLFASERSIDARGSVKLLPVGELTGPEMERYRSLLAELHSLRPSALPPQALPQMPVDLETRAPWEGMWHFRDRSPITIVCAALPAELRADERYTSPESPDFIELYAYSDLDALMELYGHLLSANPGVSVVRKLADNLSQEDITNHLVLLGGVDWNPMTRRVMAALDLPVSQEMRDDEPDIGAFRVVDADGVHVFPSTREAGHPHDRLTSDVAQFCRGPNPFNRKRTVTICNGNYGRGTYGAVRALTDPRFRDRNRDYLESRFREDDTYSLLAQVSIVDGEVITPDWTLEGTVLHEWAKPL